MLKNSFTLIGKWPYDWGFDYEMNITGRFAMHVMSSQSLFRRIDFHVSLDLLLQIISIIPQYFHRDVSLFAEMCDLYLGITLILHGNNGHKIKA